MKSIILIILLFPLAIYAQNFEGTITYSNSYQSKIPQLSDKQLNTMMGTTQEYFVRGGDYKCIFNGSYIKMQIYNNAQNKSYSLTAKSDSFYCEDYSLNSDAATLFKINKNRKTVLGTMCDELIIYSPKTKISYYFNEKLSIDPELYKNHNYGNWYYILSKTKALPLMVIYEGEQFTLTSTAIRIFPNKLSDTIFEIPTKTVCH